MGNKCSTKSDHQDCPYTNSKCPWKPCECSTGNCNCCKSIMKECTPCECSTGNCNCCKCDCDIMKQRVSNLEEQLRQLNKQRR